MTTEPLKPCPNPECRSADVRVGSADSHEYYAWCLKCELQGATTTKSSDEAVRLWNSLPRLTSVEFTRVIIKEYIDRNGGCGDGVLDNILEDMEAGQWTPGEIQTPLTPMQQASKTLKEASRAQGYRRKAARERREEL